MVNTYLSKAIAKDGEGATKLIECEVINAKDIETARKLSKSVISSSLLKAAIFGCDMNWGRIACAIGYTNCKFDINKVSINVSSKLFKELFGRSFWEMFLFYNPIG